MLTLMGGRKGFLDSLTEFQMVTGKLKIVG
jgi:hypothetical protein